jgi:hypothetical protein
MPWKSMEGVVVEIHVFFTLALGAGQRPASRPSRFTTGTHWIGGWVGPRTGVEDVENWDNSWPYRDSNSDSSVVQPAASRYTDYTIL